MIVANSTKELVEKLRSAGYKMHQIASMMKISEQQLRRYCAETGYLSRNAAKALSAMGAVVESEVVITISGEVDLWS